MHEKDEAEASPSRGHPQGGSARPWLGQRAELRSSTGRGDLPAAGEVRHNVRRADTEANRYRPEENDPGWGKADSRLRQNPLQHPPVSGNSQAAFLLASLPVNGSAPRAVRVDRGRCDIPKGQTER